MAHKELPASIHAAITRLCEEGDQLARKGDDRAAHQKYSEAWELVPEDKADWEASTWILAAVGELFFRSGDIDKAKNCFLRAVQCPKGLGNPYIHLRIGQLQFEEGNLKGAGDNLTRAYMGAGEDIFEKEDPKYLAFLRTILLPPAKEDDPTT
jgi:tetratricopeptide (TPR) repeat protein